MIFAVDGVELDHSRMGFIRSNSSLTQKNPTRMLPKKLH